MAVTIERDDTAQTIEASIQSTYADLEHARSPHARRRRAGTLALVAAGPDDGRYSLMGREVL